MLLLPIGLFITSNNLLKMLLMEVGMDAQGLLEKTLVKLAVRLHGGKVRIG